MPAPTSLTTAIRERSGTRSLKLLASGSKKEREDGLVGSLLGPSASAETKGSPAGSYLLEHLSNWTDRCNSNL